MDPTTISAVLISLFTPFVKKVSDEFAGQAGEFVAKQTGRLWEKIRMKFHGSRQEELLEKFTTNPEGHGEELKAALEEKLSADPDLGAALAAALDELRKKAPYVRVVQRLGEVEELEGVRAGRLKRGTLEVTQEADKATKVTGVVLDEIE
jgi:hypothetical protein